MTKAKFRDKGTGMSGYDRYALMLSVAIFAVIQFIAATASALFVPLKLVLLAGGMASHCAVLCDGPSPSAQTTANMPQAGLTTYYNRVFLQWLYTYTNKMLMCTHMDMPTKSGMAFRNFMNVPLGADLVQQTQGTIGNPEVISTNFKDIVLAQYANYNNISDLAWLTSISNDMENNRKIMAYQAALTIDDLVMAQFDYLRTWDTRTTNQDSTTTPYPFTKNIIEQMPFSLAGANVPTMMDGYYNGSIHPFFMADMAIDNSNNSIVDIWKHTDAGQVKLEQMPEEEETARVIELFGAHWRLSTNQTQTANWQGSGLTGISTYLAGRDAVLFINFPNSRHTKIGKSGGWKNLNVWAGEFSARTAYDTNMVIAGGTGYNFVLGLGLPPDATSRARVAIAVPQTT
jgi:hypothetical protein